MITNTPDSYRTEVAEAAKHMCKASFRLFEAAVNLVARIVGSIMIPAWLYFVVPMIRGAAPQFDRMRTASMDPALTLHAFIHTYILNREVLTIGLTPLVLYIAWDAVSGLSGVGSIFQSFYRAFDAFATSFDYLLSPLSRKALSRKAAKLSRRSLPTKHANGASSDTSAT